MIRPTVDIKGLDEVIRNIDAVNGKLLVRLQEITKASGANIAQDASSALTKDHGVETGEYKKTLKSRFTPRDITARIAPWKLGKPHPIGHILEFGTAPHDITTKDGGVINHPGSKAIPHLFPAFEREKPKYAANVAQAIRDLA